MKTNHTPSKWYQAHRENEEGMYNTEVFTKDGQVICTLHWYPKNEGNGVTSTYREANAKLISAAPCLLDALQELLASYKMYIPVKKQHNNEFIINAENAIAKAIEYKLVTE